MSDDPDLRIMIGAMGSDIKHILRAVQASNAAADAHAKELKELTARVERESDRTDKLERFHRQITRWVGTAVGGIALIIVPVVNYVMDSLLK